MSAKTPANLCRQLQTEPVDEETLQSLCTGLEKLFATSTGGWTPAHAWPELHCPVRACRHPACALKLDCHELSADLFSHALVNDTEGQAASCKNWQLLKSHACPHSDGSCHIMRRRPLCFRRSEVCPGGPAGQAAPDQEAWLQATRPASGDAPFALPPGIHDQMPPPTYVPAACIKRAFMKHFWGYSACW